MAEEKATLAKEAAGAIPLRNTNTKYDSTTETVRAALKKYAEAMATNASISVEDGIGQQQSLLRMIKMLLRLEGNDFNNGWDELMKWVFQYKDGCMGPRYRNRFLDQAKTMARRDRDLLERLIHLITATADGSTRGTVVKRYDFGRIYRVLPDQEAAAKIEGYYQQWV